MQKQSLMEPKTVPERGALWDHYQEVRGDSERLCAPLQTEDYCIQTMPDVSPAKWHLAHVSWFFENFLLRPLLPGYRPFHPQFGYLFNSYYETVGSFWPRPQRGLLSRPTVAEVYRYRAHVDGYMEALIDGVGRADWEVCRERTTLGLHHEQQHQELLLTDLKSVFALNPLRPAYHEGVTRPPCAATQGGWRDYRGGVQQMGHAGNGFAFDNEGPRHRVYLDDYRLATRPVSNGEYAEFIADDGYRHADLWLSDGWATVRREGWETPMYWERRAGQWWHMTLAGMRPVDPAAPVCHVSLYEADAYARWAGARLPTEAEWELAAAAEPIAGNLRESGRLQPAPGDTGMQLYGDVWEWTRSAYGPYPGYRPPAGALGEYNGKFMCSQTVLRGGSCLTPASHIRPTYRNFFYPKDRWQVTGIRLAQGTEAP